jgi:NADH:ubiquinone oxidoreductase subunit 4 (subunit M)
MKKIFFSSGLAPSSIKQDLGWKELLLLLPLIGVTLGLGIYPSPVIKHVESIAIKPAQVSERVL